MPFRYDASMYALSGQQGQPDFNPINAGNVYFSENTEMPTTGGQASMSAPAMAGVPTPTTQTPIMMRGIMGKPTHWWIMLVVVLAIFIFVSRRFGGPEKFGNIRLTLWNGIFAVLFYIIVLNFLKVAFSYWKVPGLSELVAAA